MGLEWVKKKDSFEDLNMKWAFKDRNHWSCPATRSKQATHFDRKGKIALTLVTQKPRMWTPDLIRGTIDLF